MNIETFMILLDSLDFLMVVANHPCNFLQHRSNAEMTRYYGPKQKTCEYFLILIRKKKCCFFVFKGGAVVAKQGWVKILGKNIRLVAL